MSEFKSVEDIMEDCDVKMGKALEHLKEEFSKIRSSRPSPALIEKLEVDYYGSPTPLKQIANFSVPEAKTLVVTPYDKTAMAAIEKAIQASDLGITPNNDGHVIRLNFPPLTEERRKELVKVVKSIAEESRIAIRNLRRQARHSMETLEKSSEMSSDDLERAEKELDKSTNSYIAKIDELLSKKEAELLEV